MEIKNSPYTYNGIKWFDGQIVHNYEMCNIRMKTFLQEQGYDVSQSVVIGYTATKKLNTTTKKELKRNNKLAMDFILEGLPNSVKEKVGKCLSTKEILDKIHDLYFEEYPITEK
jgi:hypothetical protein